MSVICERARHELSALFHSHDAQSEEVAPGVQEWMTASQLAEYWQLYNKDGEPTRMALLGQSSTKMVRRCSHATPDGIREAVQRLEQRAGGVLEFRRKTG